MKKNNKSINRQELNRWRGWFKIFFYGTPVVTISFFAAQLFFTKGDFSTNLSSIDNWSSFTKTFNLPISVFTAMAGITTLIGMYYRSLQLTVQLDKVEIQIGIANKQFEKVEHQFRLAQKQFNLSQKKENYALFLEHSKQVKEELNNKIVDAELFMLPHKPLLGKFTIEFKKFYSFCFPENSYAEVSTFNHAAKAQYFEDPFQTYETDLTGLVKLADERKISMKDLCDFINQPMTATGITYQPIKQLQNTDEIRGFMLESFRALPYIYLLLSNYNLVAEESAERCSILCREIEKKYRGI
ncbi:hypothetical protein [Pseudoalteromonas maricaloris]|uniref:hypothetical protein n=1 Tax=Pseudoalteromonas maricaloris TaxID=184924 RepID=UPI00029B2500|nr:hypothetical protein [Pseudoalteromonas flavipulchra]